jgi:hypothetical protein
LLSALFVLIGAILVFVPRHVLAWGTEGHRVSGIIAQDLLTAKTRIRVNELMGGADLADISLYMDINRKELSEKFPGSEKWHYDNEPVCKTRTYEEYCKNRDCASARIPEMFSTLQDTSASSEKRVMAMRFLVHMVGDIHQPLHAADDDDLGGNLKFVLIPESPMGRRLHGVWDTDLVKRALRGASDNDYAQSLLKKHREEDIPAWQTGELRDWMKESHTLSKLVTYSKLPNFACGKEWPSTIVSPVTLPETYLADATETIPTQLAKAGARIAWLLNEALDPSDGSSPEGASAAASKSSMAKLDNVNRAFVGQWKGALEYRDFTSNERVTLPTELIVGPRELSETNTDINSLSFRYTFDDGPGKIVRSQTAVKFDAKANVYSAQAENNGVMGKKRDEYKIVSGLDGFAGDAAASAPRTLQMLGTGEENGKAVDVRITISLLGDKLTWLRETREVRTASEAKDDKQVNRQESKQDSKAQGAGFLFRHEYKLTRSDSLAPLKLKGWPKAKLKISSPKATMPQDSAKDMMNRINKR